MKNSSSRHIYTVAGLNEKIKLLLEENLSMIWISGEISNLRIPASGHAYFTLKDDRAQISAVMFRGQLRQLKFDLDDGIVIVALGRVSAYEPRGTYQIILEYVEPKSAGALQLAFEQLKTRLALEGLFDPVHKRRPSFFPKTICIITSPTGAVIHDILHVVERRCRGVSIEVLPVRVQGEGAATQIVRAIGAANRRARAEVIVLARGGGSLEDLAAFNSEAVARAIYGSAIPIVSAVGHETDYTIADFVADVRAPTPSAAAELIVPVRADLQAKFADLHRRCLNSMEIILQRCCEGYLQLRRRLVHPKKKVQELQQHTDELSQRLQHLTHLFLRHHKMHTEELLHRLLIHNPINYMNRNKSMLDILQMKLLQSIRKQVNDQKSTLFVRHAALVALSPQAVLERGYSITRTAQEHRVVTKADGISPGQALEIILHKGKLNVHVDSERKK